MEDFVDRKTYDKYQTLDDPDFKPVLDQLVKKNPEAKYDENYAILSLDKNGICGFMDECGLCNIHKRLGPEYLSNVCMIYPAIRI